MNELYSLLLGLLCILGIVAVMGHFLWLGVAALFRALSGESSPQPKQPLRCPCCDVPLVDDVRVCLACGWPESVKGDQAAKAALDNLLEQVRRLEQLGVVNSAAAGRLLTSITEERRQVTQPTAVAPPVPLDSVAVAPLPPKPAPSIPLPAVPTGEVTSTEIVTPAVAETSAGEIDAQMRERAREYALRQDEARKVDEPKPPRIAPPPTLPRKPLSELLVSFLEEKNIRWGELIGGLLIVGSSIALVLSFWSAIAQRPLLKFGLFNGVTAALFGLGHYIHRHWKLVNTSQGLLIIATLLVPLNFLAIAAFTQDSVTLDQVTLVGEVASIGIFASLVYFTGTVITPGLSWPLVATVLGCATSQFLIRRFAVADMSEMNLWALGLAPALLYAAPLTISAWCSHRADDWTLDIVQAYFKLLGCASFAVLLAFGLLAARADRLTHDFSQLAPLLPLLGWPSLLIGLIVWSRTTDETLVGWRTAGTSIAVLGAGIGMGAIALAWPDPAMNVAVAVINFVVLTIAASRFDLPAGHSLAALSLACAYSVSMLVIRGLIDWRSDSGPALVDALFEPGNGAALVPLTLVLGAVAGGWARGGRKVEALSYGGVTGLVAVVSLLLVTLRGLGMVDDGGATYVYLLYGVGAIAGAMAIQRSELAWFGSTLLLVGIVQAIVYRFDEAVALNQPWLVALLVDAMINVMAGALLRRHEAWFYGAARPLEKSALVVSSAAALLVIVAVAQFTNPGEMATYTLVLAAVWGLGAWVQFSHAQFAAFQAAVSLVVLLVTTQLMARESWYEETPWPQIDPRRLQWYGIALGLLGMSWTAARIVGRQRAGDRRWFQLIAPPHVTVDQIVSVFVVALTAVMSVAAVWPGTVQEVARLATVSHDLWIGRIPLQHASTAAAWLLWCTALLLIIAHAAERFRPWLIGVGISIVWLVCPLAAAEIPGATASTWRWWCAGFLIVATAVHVARKRLQPLATRMGWTLDELQSSVAVATSRTISFMLSALPIVGLSLLEIVGDRQVTSQMGVAADSFFARIGELASHLIPLGVLATALMIVAIRDRLPHFALLGGLTLHFMAHWAYWRWPTSIAGRERLLDVLELAQLHALVGGTYTLTWFGYVRQFIQRGASGFAALSKPLQVQQFLAVAAWSLYAIVTGVLFWLDPRPFPVLLDAAGLMAWISGVVSLASWLGPAYLGARRLSAARVTWAAVTMSVLVGLTISRLGTAPWLGFHTWQVSLVFISTGLLFVAKRYWPDDLRSVGRSITAVWWLVMATSFRAIVNDPHAPWWAVGGLFCAAVLSAVLATWMRQRWRVAAAAVLLNIAVSLVVLTIQPREEWAFYLWNVVALTLPNALWVWIDRRWIAADGVSSPRGIGWHRVAPVLAMLMLPSWVLALANDRGVIANAHDGLTWLAWFSTAVAIIATLWDPRTRFASAALYALGLLAVALGAVQLAQLNLSRHDAREALWWTGVMFTAAYSLGTSYLWSRRQEILALASRWGLPVSTEMSLRELVWLVPANSLLIVGVLFGAGVIDLRFEELSWRLATGKAALLQVVSLGLLARGERRSLLQRGALTVGVVGAVVWGWAWLPSEVSLLHIDRLVIAIVACAVTLGLYALGIIKLLRRDNSWTEAAQSLSPALAGLVVLGVVTVLGVEVQQQMIYHEVLINRWAVMAMIGICLGLATLSLVAALVPGRDPFQLSERGRTVYVYAAEAWLGLLFLHVRLTMPELFRGTLAQYWPLIVMAIAFIGIGLSEIFRRQQRLVLYEPLERTGALLPLLPVLGFWVAGSEVHYSWIMVVAGSLYGLMAILRKSFGYSILAALGANGALWYLLGRLDGFSITEHPQLWFAPPAVCVLVAAHLNRARLTPQQLTTIRYLTSSVVYISSTADIFLRGVRNAPWLPLVLGGLSILGVFLGIALRVRAFLFLGATFLLIALTSIIKYAAVDLEQTWIWAVTGIIAGVLILALFAVFEKRRQDILKLVEGLKEWEK